MRSCALSGPTQLTRIRTSTNPDNKKLKPNTHGAGPTLPDASTPTKPVPRPRFRELSEYGGSGNGSGSDSDYGTDGGSDLGYDDGDAAYGGGGSLNGSIGMASMLLDPGSLRRSERILDLG